MKQKIRFIGISLFILVLAIQSIPYTRDHTNPPVNSEPPWPDPATHALAIRACYDCHSNETVWPWYSNFAPMSWLIYRDVTVGREHINFSDWNRPEEQHVDEFQEVFDENSMPPFVYLLSHPDARLSPEERQVLFEGLLKLAEGTSHQ